MGRKGAWQAIPNRVGVPLAASERLVLDMATPMVARWLSRRSLAAGEASIPEGCVLDAAGNPTTSAAAAITARSCRLAVGTAFEHPTIVIHSHQAKARVTIGRVEQQLEWLGLAVVREPGCGSI